MCCARDGGDGGAAHPCVASVCLTAAVLRFLESAASSDSVLSILLTYRLSAAWVSEKLPGSLHG